MFRAGPIGAEIPGIGKALVGGQSNASGRIVERLAGLLGLRGPPGPIDGARCQVGPGEIVVGRDTVGRQLIRKRLADVERLVVGQAGAGRLVGGAGAVIGAGIELVAALLEERRRDRQVVRRRPTQGGAHGVELIGV